MLLQSGRPSDLGVCRTRSDQDRSVMKFDLLGEDAGDIHQARRRMPAALHIPQQRLAAGE